MFRVTVMSRTAYAVEIGDDCEAIEREAENIHSLVTQGNPVIIVEELSELEDFGINPDDVQIVEV